MEKQALRCVGCGSGSLDRVGTSDTSVTLCPDRDGYETNNPLGTRGEWGQVDLICFGCQTRQRFCFGNHKGTEFIGLFRVE